jgi:hypothetical protein
MLAGVGGIDAVVLVIAADEGVMPQTKEHLAILDLLQIPTGMVALTKTDLVPDPEWLDLVESDIRESLAGTVLENAPFARVSAKSGAGLENLLSTLLYYAYLTEHHEERLGHNALAGTAYFFTIILAILQFTSGLYLLYPENGFFVSLGSAIFGTQQEARFIHYILNWYFAWFALVHIYIVVWNDIKNPEGLISSIFDGYKFHKKES